MTFVKKLRSLYANLYTQQHDLLTSAFFVISLRGVSISQFLQYIVLYTYSIEPAAAAAVNEANPSLLLLLSSNGVTYFPPLFLRLKAASFVVGFSQSSPLALLFLCPFFFGTSFCPLVCSFFILLSSSPLFFFSELCSTAGITDLWSLGFEALSHGTRQFYYILTLLRRRFLRQFSYFV